MRLEDALLYAILETGPAGSSDAAERCSQAIAGGVDVIQIAVEDPEGAAPGKGMARDDACRVVAACRRDDALAIVQNASAVAADLGADGVLLDNPTMSIAMARSHVGPEGMIGVSARSLDEARLALAVGADYVVQWGGRTCPGIFSGLRGEARVPLYAAGMGDLAEAQEVVVNGVYRLCVDWSLLNGADVRERAAEFSRILGRCV